MYVNLQKTAWITILAYPYIYMCVCVCIYMYVCVYVHICIHIYTAGEFVLYMGINSANALKGQSVLSGLGNLVVLTNLSRRMIPKSLGGAPWLSTSAIPPRIPRLGLSSA